MSLLFVDTSAIVGAYLEDESEHAALRATVLEGSERVVSSEIARVEFGRAVRTAGRDGRLSDWQTVLDRFDADCQNEGRIRLLRLRPEAVLPQAYRLVLDHRLRTLDAIHLAVALVEAPDLDELGQMVFITRDRNQAEAAASLGLEVR